MHSENTFDYRSPLKYRCFPHSLLKRLIHLDEPPALWDWEAVMVAIAYFILLDRFVRLFCLQLQPKLSQRIYFSYLYCYRCCIHFFQGQTWNSQSLFCALEEKICRYDLSNQTEKYKTNTHINRTIKILTFLNSSKFFAPSIFFFYSLER